MLTQAVFLAGGLGARLKHLTQTTPKPLIEVDGRPFLDILIQEAARHGFTDILILAGYLGEQMSARYEGRRWRGATVRVVVEPEPLGTGGALKFAAPHLAPEFLLFNGDTLFDINLRALAVPGMIPAGGGVLALRQNIAGQRYGRVGFDGTHVRSFHAPGEIPDGPISAGVAGLSRDIIGRLPEGPASLEAAVYPALAREGLLKGLAFDRYFIDMGIPMDLERARAELPAHLRRPALFLDRDGVLNRDKNYVHRPADFEWLPGAKRLVRLCNDRGWFVFVVTNQAGVAHGLYDEAAIQTLHDFMGEELALEGAHIDAFEYCPHHPDAKHPDYRKACDRRKPGPGMIRDLLKAWSVDAARSFLVGDMAHDVAAAEAAGIRGYRFEGGDLANFVEPLLG